MILITVIAFFFFYNIALKHFTLRQYKTYMGTVIGCWSVFLDVYLYPSFPYWAAHLMETGPCVYHLWPCCLHNPVVVVYCCTFWHRKCLWFYWAITFERLTSFWYGSPFGTTYRVPMTPTLWLPAPGRVKGLYGIQSKTFDIFELFILLLRLLLSVLEESGVFCFDVKVKETWRAHCESVRLYKVPPCSRDLLRCFPAHHWRYLSLWWEVWSLPTFFKMVFRLVMQKKVIQAGNGIDWVHFQVNVPFLRMKRAVSNGGHGDLISHPDISLQGPHYIFFSSPWPTITLKAMTRPQLSLRQRYRTVHLKSPDSQVS